MSRPRATYKIILRNKNGGLTNIRFATSYEIYYGSRRILKRTDFPRYAFKEFSKETTAKKRVLLERKVKRIERERLAILEIKRIEREEARRKKARKKVVKKKVSKKPSEFIEPEEIIPEEAERKVYKQGTKEDYIQRFYQASLDEVLWGKGTEEEPVVLPDATIDEVMIFPFTPKHNDYEKSLIEKRIMRGLGRVSNLTILNYTITKPIAMNADNFTEVAPLIRSEFIPHIAEFFDRIKDVREDFIVRLKFRYATDGNKYFDQGISMARFRTNDIMVIIKNFTDAIRKLHGTYDKENNRYRTKNYLMGTMDLFVTGFTLEAGESVESAVPF